jgi:hypothetical protein
MRVKREKWKDVTMYAQSPPEDRKPRRYTVTSGGLHVVLQRFTSPGLENQWWLTCLVLGIDRVPLGECSSSAAKKIAMIEVRKAIKFLDDCAKGLPL